ncbi:PLAC8 family-domain-containing protein [Pyronema domesticum]|uniref:Similar to Protein PLANT CADMIUM RESISTANCE 7 acc. no. Q9LS43 n=1 Tax=Pyronema omphalodes (strain CBS 100304) TaxID=1076935 RepID=U4LB26_PYROM|nr:PLAC8 family-domain-containing protein [Pyronema domesticum]CCX07369.1 Similar to Protein PLANT CADMIUM RESISTANCE 7; acc. no. Q9LS43 [Pyronema omphalodes CBS 100304]
MTDKWENSLFSCFSNMNTCMMATFCPCILFGRTRYRLRHPSLDGHNCCNFACFTQCICISTPISCIQRMMQRKEIREKHNLEGGCCGDCMKSCFCSCCELAQEENEVLMKQSKAQEQVGYIKPQGMVYVPSN